MDIVRNFIKISGVTDETELPSGVKGPVIQYSEIETIFVPEKQPGIQSIFQIMLKVEITSNRLVNTPIGSTIIMDGVKKYKIIYTGSEDSGKAGFLNIDVPYNTFVELPKDSEINNINVYVLDAYFSLLDSRKIYSHLLYMVSMEVVSSAARKKIVKANTGSPVRFEDYTINSGDKSNTGSPAHFDDYIINPSDEVKDAGDSTNVSSNTVEVNENNKQDYILIDLDAEYL